MTMRLRDAERGTVVTVGDESAKRLQAAGWKSADSSSKSSTSTQDEETAKPKRRTRRSE